MQRRCWPWWEFQGSLKGLAGMQGLAVRDDHALERKAEHRTQIGESTFVVSRRHPHSRRSASLCERIAENQGPVFWKPERRLVPAQRVPERQQATRYLVVRLDLFHFCFRGSLIGILDVGTERTASIAADGSIDAPGFPIAPGLAQVIGEEDRHCRGRPLSEPVPDLGRVVRGEKRIEQPAFVARVHAGAGHHLLPVNAWVPCGMFEPPYTETWRQVDQFDIRRATFGDGSEDYK